MSAATVQERLGHYRLIKKLGEGGMGVVYAAEDERLGREVALKMVRAELAGSAARERLRREARAAASVTHPNVCQLYEIGEADGELFITMELLSGQPLSDRIAEGPLTVRESRRIMLDVLAALSALHRRGILHRDLKPSNVFLTEHGAKLLDFGVARALEPTQETMVPLTGPGAVMGTARYMAPECAAGDAIDARADVFAAGAVLYEMLSGRPAFGGDTAVRVLHAVMYEQPPSLTGATIVAGLDRVIQRALAKQASARYESAAAFADDLRLGADDSSSLDAVRARQTSRLIVLPFRLLRPDPEIDFLAFSLADAVATSLSSFGSLVVRSSLTAVQFAGESVDLQKIAREADVDVVLSGTILRAGDRVRFSAQLVEAPSGAIVWSDTLQVSFSDIFQLHDTLVHTLLDALSVPLTAREHRLVGRDVPATPKAYESFLRANELAKEPTGWEAAVDLYTKCLDLDPRYAPAWARLGRVYRLLSKYRADHNDRHRALAEEALGRALTLNPDLSMAHNTVAQMEVEKGQAREAMLRLLRQAAAGASDPELYAALCHVCRYCGLLEASVAAHHLAIRRDPKVNTSVLHTWFLMGQYERIIECDLSREPYIGALSFAALGRRADALAVVRETRPKVSPVMRTFMQAAEWIVDEQAPRDLSALRGLLDQFRDPEGLYYLSRAFAKLGEPESAVVGFTRAVARGYFCHPTFASDSWLDPLRGHGEFVSAMERARLGHAAAIADFKAVDGDRILS